MKKVLIFTPLILISVVKFNLGLAAQPNRSGEEIFRMSCQSCHQTNFPNAPQAHDQTAWQKKYSISEQQAKQKYPECSEKDLPNKTMEILVSKVKNGNKTMPAKGLCNDCSDQEYEQAIKFMMAPK